MKKNIISFFVVVMFFLIIYFVTPSYAEATCNTYKEFNHLDINGVVVKKFIDRKQHSYPMILIKNFSNSYTVSINLSYDTTNLYNRLELSDTVHKAKGSVVLSIIENGIITFEKRIDFGCQ